MLMPPAPVCATREMKRIKQRIKSSIAIVYSGKYMICTYVVRSSVMSANDICFCNLLGFIPFQPISAKSNRPQPPSRPRPQATSWGITGCHPWCRRQGANFAHATLCQLRQPRDIEIFPPWETMGNLFLHVSIFMGI